jgi:hypothetical protein
VRALTRLDTTCPDGGVLDGEDTVRKEALGHAGVAVAR